MACLTSFLSYKVELNLSKSIYGNNDSAVEIYLQLGGRTSEIDKVRLTLVDDKRNTMRVIPVSDLGAGKFIAPLDPASLPSGHRYGVILEYPTPEVNLTRFTIGNLKREQWFFVARSPEASDAH